VAAIGQGVLFSLALTGAVRIACLLSGTTLSERIASCLFLISSVLTGSLGAYLYARMRKRADAHAGAGPCDQRPE
jgi:hypothetical protein